MPSHHFPVFIDVEAQFFIQAFAPAVIAAGFFFDSLFRGLKGAFSVRVNNYWDSWFLTFSGHGRELQGTIPDISPDIVRD